MFTQGVDKHILCAHKWQHSNSSLRGWVVTCPEIAYIADLYWWLHTSAIQVHGQYHPYKCPGGGC